MHVLTVPKAILVCTFVIWAGTSLAERSCLDSFDDQPPRQLAAPQILRGKLCQPDGTCEAALLWAGPIPADAADLYLTRIAQAQQYPDGTEAHWICLWSGGGAVDTADDLGRTLKWMGLNTCVVPVEEPLPGTFKRVPRKTSGVLCASACVTMFLGGKRKTMHPEAALGVHRSSIDGPVSCLPATWRGQVSDFSQMSRRIFIGSPWKLEALLEWHALRTSNSSITAIRAADIAEVGGPGLVVTSAVWRTVNATDLAQSR